MPNVTIKQLRNCKTCPIVSLFDRIVSQVMHSNSVRCGEERTAIGRD
ncbi:hypothetical protein [Methylicorpusculum sp.]|nr:hypothetical protein [Methylicorpusculum sp.]MDO8844327.1 hypothetical protein [Methylicorpusculum sp.]